MTVAAASTVIVCAVIGALEFLMVRSSLCELWNQVWAA